MKKLDRRQLKPCSLEPVEKSAPLPLPGVPVHFNYGIFFDDGYDYMQHLKEASELSERSAYKITGIPEDSVLDNTNEESEPVNERPREPEADPRDMVVEGLGIDSDDEIEVDSDLEDNFVEIAGGHTVEDEDTDEPDGTRQKIDSDRVRHANPREVLAQDKVLMMERFLYGDNERDRQDEHETGTEGDSDDEPGEATVLNRQFEKLMVRCKAWAGSASQTMVTGSSMMSEGLQYALKRDTRMLHHEKPKSDELENLESDLKSKTLAIADQALLHTSTESIDAQSEQESSNEPLPDIVSVQNEVASSATRPNYNILSVPINPKTATQRSRQVSMESLQTVGQVPPVAVLKTTETELDPTLLVRSRGETPEEKQQRKLAVKRYRQERRKVRKVNQANFRAEHERQIKSQGKTLTMT